MKAYLMHHDRDVDTQESLPWNADDLIQDLGLATLFAAMAGADRFLPDVARRSVLCGLRDVDSVLYRQNVLRDCLANPDVVRAIYALAEEAIKNEGQYFWGLRSQHADTILNRARELVKMFLGILKRLRTIAEGHESAFASEGFVRFFSMLRRELDDEYLARAHDQLRRVEFRGGILISARLGRGNRGEGYVLRNYEPRLPRWFERLFPLRESGYTYWLHPRDESGARALSELEDRGINLVADALAQSVDHILAFFTTLRYEVGFYVACINLHEELAAKNEPVCFPVPSDADAGIHNFTGLYDVCLSLATKPRVVGNDCNADDKAIILVTGANQGGKSTFLRSVGLSHLMMECGMFVPATSLRASLCSGLFTHYKREEDLKMKSGKFDEELRRMSDLAERLRPSALLLFNESFAATNDREGSEIARQISEALVDSGIRVCFVTHLYEFAYRIWEERAAQTRFLRAERGHDGKRTFRLVEAEPLPTSYGEDIYRRVFGSFR
jgi:DNA mismatch repair ATPase MutS